MPVPDWFPLLVVSLEAVEAKRRAAYYGEPADYEPFFAPEELTEAVGRRSRQDRVVSSILAFAGMTTPVRGSLDQVAKMRPDLVQQVYIDEQGAVVDAAGKPMDVPASAVVVGPDGRRLGDETPPAKSQAEDRLQAILGVFGIGEKED